MKVVDLKALEKEHGLQGYSKLKKAELITFLQNNLQPTPAPCTRPPKPTRPPPPPPQLVRFRLRPKQNVMPGSQQLDIFEQKEIRKSRPQVTSKLEDWYDWLANHVPEPIKDKVSKVFKTFKDKVMGLYNRVKGEKNTNTGNELSERKTRISLIKDQTQVKTYEVTGNLNYDVSNLILKTIKPVIKMRTRVIYSFSCSIFRGRNQVVQYHKTLSDNRTFTSLREIEEYIKRCELKLLNLDNDEVWSEAYLPASRITDNPGVYKGRVEFQRIHIWLISSNEPLMGCGPLPDWLRGKRCIYSIDNVNDNLCGWRCLVVFERIRRNRQRPEEDTTREALNLARKFYNQP